MSEEFFGSQPGELKLEGASFYGYNILQSCFSVNGDENRDEELRLTNAR